MPNYLSYKEYLLDVVNSITKKLLIINNSGEYMTLYSDESDLFFKVANNSLYVNNFIFFYLADKFDMRTDEIKVALNYLNEIGIVPNFRSKMIINQQNWFSYESQK